MNNLYFVGILLCLWALYRSDIIKLKTEWFYIITDSRRELNERLKQAESSAEAFESLCGSRLATIELKNGTIETMKRQLNNRNGQITKLRKQRDELWACTRSRNGGAK